MFLLPSGAIAVVKIATNEVVINRQALHIQLIPRDVMFDISIFLLKFQQLLDCLWMLNVEQKY
jgi:hypothetical protein